MSPSSAAVRRAAGSWTLLAVAAGVVVSETLLRAVLAFVVSPLLSVLCPPVAAVVGGGFVARVVDPTSADQTSGDDGPGDDWRAAARGLPLGRLAALAVLGHLVAVVGGVAAFLVVDTAVRGVGYWLGFEYSLAVVALLPLLGVGVATAVCWAVPARAVPAVVHTGRTATESLSDALVCVARRPRVAVRSVGLHLAVVATLVGVVVAGVGFLAASNPSTVVLVVVLSVTGGLAFLLATFGVAVVLTVHGRRPDSGETRRRRGRSETAEGRQTAGRRRTVGVVFAVLVVGALVAGAGVVRIGEHRPTETSPAALPDDPDAMYATALSNTEATSHRYRVAVLSEGDDEPFVVEHRVDRADRQYRQLLRGKAAGTDVYADTGVGSPALSGFDVFSLGTRTVGDDRPVRAVPDYFRWTARYDLTDGSGLTPPSPTSEGWSVVERRDGAVVLAMDEPKAIFEATTSGGLTADAVGNVTVARLRAVVDTDDRTLRRVEYRFEADVVTDETTASIDADVHYEFETGVDVTRPDVLGPRTVGEWTWDLFAY